MSDPEERLDGVNKPTLDAVSEDVINDNKRYVDGLILLTNESVNKIALLVDGTNQPTADVNLANNKITNLKNPDAPKDVCNERYTDSQIDSKCLTVNFDGELQKDINLNNQRVIYNALAPVQSHQLVNKEHVDRFSDTGIEQTLQMNLGFLVLVFQLIRETQLIKVIQINYSIMSGGIK